MQGNKNVIIQSVSGSTLTLNVNGEVLEIQNQLTELKVLLQNLKVQNVHYADKIYNIGHINEANFGIVTSNRVFNGVLTKELIALISDKPKTKQFLNGIPAEDKENWECVRIHLKEAQSLLENSSIWVIGWELRRLFSIGNDKQNNTDAKIDDYVNHCLRTCRLSLQLVNYLFLSKLWDDKKINKNIGTNKKPIVDFFNTNRMLKLSELRALLHTLIDIFDVHGLSFPLPEMMPDGIEQAGIRECADPNSVFNKACLEMETLEAIDPNSEAYGLGHCHTAEIALATVLMTFQFFTAYQLVTMKRVEYEQTRTSAPRYIKDFNILERKEAGSLQRMLRYDNKPSLTYAVFFRNELNAINLFPFLLDYNALTNEQDFHIFNYECREGNSGLRYFSNKNEKEEVIHYQAAGTETREIKSDEQKNEEQRNIRLDLVIKQFEEALNTILDTDLHFVAVESTMKQDNMDNF